MSTRPQSGTAKSAVTNTFDDFARVIDRTIYRPLPDDWWVAATDVVGSTKAIEAGRYKAVNMAGVSAISATMNAFGGDRYPFAFGGDGAGMAVPPEHEEKIRDVLARTVCWSREELGLELRAALIPVADIRSADRDVLVAYYAPSTAVRYAMFGGGGMEWAEVQLKADRYSVPSPQPGARPDLSGLSCRWKPITARSGVMLSVIVRQSAKADEERFFTAVNEILALLEDGDRQGHPVPVKGPDFGSPLMGFDLEARASRPVQAPAWWKLKLLAWRIFAWSVVKTGASVGGFEPAHYQTLTALNSDFRKFHDGLYLTVDCTPDQADRIEALLLAGEEEGVLRFGLFRQTQALMTCIVPSYTADDHFHFIDGAGGGYALAARRLKAH